MINIYFLVKMVMQLSLHNCPMDNKEVLVKDGNTLACLAIGDTLLKGENPLVVKVCHYLVDEV